MTHTAGYYQKFIGSVFGELTVTEFIEQREIKGRGRYVPMVRVQCSCGNEKICSLWDLKSGKTKTCRLSHPHFRDRTLPAFNAIYSTYKKRGEERGVFEFTKEEFRKITQQPCYYCGVLPQNALNLKGTEQGHRIKTGKFLSTYTYNGLDRVDNTVGYTKQNTVPCCSICNHAKAAMTENVFLEWLDRIIDFRITTTRPRNSLNYVQG